MKEDFEQIAKTFYGLEDVLRKELVALGAKNVTVLNRAVRYVGDKELMYKANLWLRTAIKILKPVHRFKATNAENLYSGVQEINWSKYLDVSMSFAIDSVINTTRFKHSGFVSLKVKDAIVDQIRKKEGERPSVNLKSPDLRINVHISDMTCTISLDSSEQPLFKRAYREYTDIAPLNEVLAAGIILMSGWSSDTALYDPMCGSGTILIEAALIALGIAPGLSRKHFGFFNWKDFDESCWTGLMDMAKHSSVAKSINIQGSDISREAIEIANKNIHKAGLDTHISIERKAFDEVEPNPAGGVLIMNPPYGERIKDVDISLLYKSIGDKLKKSYAGYDAWIISSNNVAFKSLGLRPSYKTKLYNGQLECKLHKYSVYEGSRKSKYNIDNA